ncbi:unnamed protein product, partial [Miscanthus lutarioriparius]
VINYIKCLMGQPKQPAKLAMLIAQPLPLLCYEAGNSEDFQALVEFNEDFQALVEFKQGITDPKGVLKNWNPDTHFCRWYGVNCSSNRPYHITEIKLSGKNLAGNISSSLGKLAFLHTLDLSSNSFYGPIPNALTNCSNLAYLDLSTNKLTSVIPPTIGSLTNLAKFYLDSNYVTGGIPAALGNMTNLRAVSFSQNQLNGSIPHEGAIPNSIGNLSTNLTRLLMGGNSLSEYAQTVHATTYGDVYSFGVILLEMLIGKKTN